MKNVIKNYFNKELIVYAIAEPDTGHVALNCSTIRKCVELGKKVLFYSLDQPEDRMTKRIGLNDNTNLLIKDKLVNNLEEINNTIDIFKPDLVIIDYFMLLTRDTKVEDIFVLNRIAKEHNIPFIVVTHLSSTDNKGLDFSNVTYEEFKEANFKSTPLIEEADRLMLFYKKSETEYMVRVLKNNFTETPQWFSRPSVFDIRDLLN